MSLTEIRDLHIELSEKETHTNESLILKIFYLHGLWSAVKTPSFYGNAYLHICSIWWYLEVSSLTECQYLHIEPSEKGTHTNEKNKI